MMMIISSGSKSSVTKPHSGVLKMVHHEGQWSTFDTFCDNSHKRLYRPFFSIECTVKSNAYHEILRECPMPRLTEKSEYFTF
jgi:hypothetical protein